MPRTASPAARAVAGWAAAAALLVASAVRAAAPPAPLAPAAAEGAAGAPAGDLAAVKARGKLVMLTYPVQGNHFISVNLDAMREQGLKLQELHKPEQFQGIDVELMSGFARSLGVALEIRPILGGYGALIPALLQRQGDLVASEFTITPERRTKADFTAPYVSNWVAVVVRRVSGIRSAADLAGKKGAALRGSSHVELLKAAAPSATVQPTDFDLESLHEVDSGAVAFALMDTNAEPGGAVDAIHPGLKVAFRLVDIGDGIAVRPGSDLLPPLNAYLESMKASGELERILERNGFRPKAKGGGPPGSP
jgi:ABC-type amino acid transport substrate-binding protein